MIIFFLLKKNIRGVEIKDLKFFLENLVNKDGD